MDYIDRLNPQQREAVLAPAGANLVLAGAGSGKTRVIVARILHLLEEGAEPSSLLAITFTNKAAGEMRERLRAALGPARVRGLWVGTFHAVCARILRQEAELAGVPADFAVLSRSECLTLLKREMAAAGISAERYPPKSILERIGRLKTSGGEPAEPGLAFSAEAVAARLRPRYERALRAAGGLDFDDLLALPIGLFRRHPETLRAYQERFLEVLVDEYQDTNPIQHRLVSLLAGGGGRVFAVGDDDQSIYRWRGADVENIRRFERAFPGARTFRLEENYRCSGRILAAAGEVMRGAFGRREKRLFTANPPGEPVAYFAAPDPEVEAQMVFERLVHCGAGGEVPWEEVAVFYRTNTQSRPLEEAARRRGVPYQVVKGQRFFDRAEVQDLAAYLRAAMRPDDGPAFSRIVNRPPRGLGAEKLKALAGGGEEEEPLSARSARRALEAGRLSGAAARALGELLDALDELASRALGPAALIEEVLSRTGYRKWLEDTAAKSASAERRRAAARAQEGIAEFAAAAAAFEERLREEEGVEPERPEAKVGFLEELALMGESDEMEEAAGKLSLMTLHAAKGLEFRVVAIVGVQEGLIPHGRSTEDPESTEEERRLLYVGMTRAKERLLLSWAKERRPDQGGGSWASRPSRFLEPLGEAHLAREGDHAPAERRPRRAFRGPSSRYDELLSPSSSARAAAPKAPAGPPPQALGPYAPGARVEHKKFGPGVVVERTGAGEGAVVTVDFPEVGRKRLVLKYAPIRPA